jgi:hypothetical protein
MAAAAGRRRGEDAREVPVKSVGFDELHRTPRIGHARGATLAPGDALPAAEVARPPPTTGSRTQPRETKLLTSAHPCIQFGWCRLAKKKRKGIDVTLSAEEYPRFWGLRSARPRGERPRGLAHPWPPRRAGIHDAVRTATERHRTRNLEPG